MLRPPIRVYADASVFGGVFDEEFEHASRRFFELVEQGRFHLVTSPPLQEELIGAPAHVQELFENLSDFAELADDGPEARSLMEAYLTHGVVSRKYRIDALHVAIATVSNCAIIVSWNLKYIVNYRRIPLYNGVNMSRGYSSIAIYSPQELIADEDEEEDF